MHMDKVAGSGNDEFYTPAYAVAPLVKYIDKDARVWCPFDTERSLFVRMLRKNGNKVTATHISSGHDFFTTFVDCDCIVSNPPYSKKAEVIERLFLLDIPFAMLVGVVGLFESQRRFDLFRSNDFEVMYLNRRVAYLRDYSDPQPSLHPPFSSVYLCRGVLPSRIVFEEIERGRQVKRVEPSLEDMLG